MESGMEVGEREGEGEGEGESSERNQISSGGYTQDSSILINSSFTDATLLCSLLAESL